MNSILRYEIAGKTHAGRKRTNNEDNLFFRVERPTMMVVADGMGGHAKGEEASKIVVKSIPQLFQRSHEFHKGNFEAIAVDLVRQTNRLVKEEAILNRSCWGMGSTVVFALAHYEIVTDGYFNYVTVAHVGDSRCYTLRDGELKLRTKDHSDGANMLSRAIGHGMPSPDIIKLPVIMGDTIMLCSDGLTKMVSDESIQSTLENAHTCEQAVDILIQKALDAGGDDNITVIVARPQRNDIVF